MSLDLLFAGMTSELDGDVKINNTVTAPTGGESNVPEESPDQTTETVPAEDSDQTDDSSTDEEATEQTEEVTEDTANAVDEAKDTEVAAQMLTRISSLYCHAKKFGIDRTFVGIYNRNGELDRICGIKFPSCESMGASINRYSQYSTAFIAAMEDNSDGLWARFKQVVKQIWEWISEKAASLWDKILKLLHLRDKSLKDTIKKIKDNYDINDRVNLDPNTELAKLVNNNYLKQLLDKSHKQIEQGKNLLPILIDTANVLQKEAAHLDDEEAAARVKAVADKWDKPSEEYNNLAHSSTEDNEDKGANSATLKDILSKLEEYTTMLDKDVPAYEALRKSVTDTTKKTNDALKSVKKAKYENGMLAIIRLMNIVEQPQRIIKLIILKGKDYLQKATAFSVELNRVVKQLKPKAQKGTEAFDLIFL